jgi:RNA polymerase sigma-70 factor (ECF subfamily)
MHLEDTRSKMNRSEEYLLELALAGDTACFGELIERWQRRIYGFICRYVGNTDEAQDLTQDTFTKAYKNLDRLADPERFSSWLYTIALNECRMRFRRKRKIQLVALPEEDGEIVPIPLQDQAASPEAKLAVKEDIQVLREAFNGLPEEQREVILMKEYQDLKFHEISDILGIPLSTVKSRMYLGLKTLRKLMENQR